MSMVGSIRGRSCQGSVGDLFLLGGLAMWEGVSGGE